MQVGIASRGIIGERKQLDAQSGGRVVQADAFRFDAFVGIFDRIAAAVGKRVQVTVDDRLGVAVAVVEDGALRRGRIVDIIRPRLRGIAGHRIAVFGRRLRLIDAADIAAVVVVQQSAGAVARHRFVDVERPAGGRDGIGAARKGAVQQRIGRGSRASGRGQASTSSCKPPL